MTYHIKNQNYGTELPYGLCLLYKYWTHSHGLESNNTLQYHSQSFPEIPIFGVIRAAKHCYPLNLQIQCDSS